MEEIRFGGSGHGNNTSELISERNAEPMDWRGVMIDRNAQAGSGGGVFPGRALKKGCGEVRRDFARVMVMPSARVPKRKATTLRYLVDPAGTRRADGISSVRYLLDIGRIPS